MTLKAPCLFIKYILWVKNDLKSIWFHYKILPAHRGHRVMGPEKANILTSQPIRAAQKYSTTQKSTIEIHPFQIFKRCVWSIEKEKPLTKKKFHDSILCYSNFCYNKQTRAWVAFRLFELIGIIINNSEIYKIVVIAVYNCPIR